MNNPQLFRKTLLAAAVLLTTQQATAAGFQLNAQSATGLGRAFAGDAVIADNASVMARNPAAMALFDDVSLSLGVVSIASEIEVKDSTYNSLGSPAADSNYSDAGDTSYVPNIHVIVPINEKFAVGVNLYSNFGTKTEFDDNFVGSEYGGLTDVKSMNLGLSGSYRIDEQWSIGAGLDIIYGTGKLQRDFSATFPGGAANTTALDADAAGIGFGFNLGTVYELNENNRFGLSYHYSPELEAKGDITYAPNLSQPVANDDTLYMPLPDMAEFSGYHRLEDTKFAVHYSVQWIGWAAFDTLDSDAHGTINTYKWKNAMHYSIGGTYYLNEEWTLRTGYMYDQSAQDEVTSISVPDSDRQWFSAGFTYHLDAKSNIDFGATYLVGKDVTVHEEKVTSGGTVLSSIDATTRANAVLLGVQYTRSF
ncbi:MAG: outer membrane protein transport protein [Aliivibrio sp.]|uniref:outer membrane protein transport protein n=1 Tax=Aliivibrio sp. TaxID=1872443 RepID=UPI001A386CD8|nr:outer membrane protein transport protein [Aliivibrio sp.]